MLLTIECLFHKKKTAVVQRHYQVSKQGTSTKHNSIRDLTERGSHFTASALQGYTYMNMCFCFYVGTM